ncbi:MAG: hypothetical protein DWQ37_11215 [Planctomycetota bacterium]|nr:MAG: hypothetical protein DWQ37_11215 [Planctomycetota bacterium]
MITSIRGSAKRAPVVGEDFVAEQYYGLAHWIQTSGPAAGGTARTVGVTSPAAGAGVSTVAASLAAAAAQQSDRPVLLIDLSGSSLLSKVKTRVGDDELAPGETNKQSSAQPEIAATTVPNLSRLSLGPTTGRPPYSGGSIEELIRDLDGEFGFIVVDLPPVESSACLAIAGILDWLLMVVEARRTASLSATRGMQRLALAGARVLGVIFNRCSPDLPRWLDSRL